MSEPQAQERVLLPLTPCCSHRQLQELLRGQIKLFLRPEMQMCVVILCSLVFVVILSRPLLFPALSLTSRMQMDVRVHGIILGGVGVVGWGFFYQL